MLCEQAVRRGGLDKVTDSMWLVLFFQSFYVADGLYNEVCQFLYIIISAGDAYLFTASYFYDHGHHH